MKRTTPGLTVSKAIPGFPQYKGAEGLNPLTIDSYRDNLTIWYEYIGERPVGQVTPQQIREFLVWLRTTHKPRRLGGADQPLAPKTIRNFRVTLSAFFHWARDEFGITSPVNGVPAAKFQASASSRCRENRSPTC